MESPVTTVGILAPSGEVRETLRSQLDATRLATVEVEVERYCAVSGDRPTRRFVEAGPEVIIVDMDDPEAAIQALRILHAALPETWLLVTSGINDPEQIIETMRAGAREFLRMPISLPKLAEAFSRYAAEKQQRQHKQESGKLYCVTAAKGGVGATSLCINLASTLAQAPGTRVALIDLNSPAGDAGAHLNLTPKFTVTDALDAASRLDPTLLESYMCQAQNFAVMTGPKEFWPELAPGVNGASSASALTRMLEVVAETYTHTLVDVTTSLNKQRLQMVVEMAASVVVVLTPELPAVWRTQHLLSFLKTCGDTEKLRLVINRSRRTDQITQEEIEKTLQHRVYWTLPNNYNDSIEAINSGNPLVSLNHSELSKSYRELAHRLAGIAPVKKKRLGFLSLFSNKPRN